VFVWWGERKTEGECAREESNLPPIVIAVIIVVPPKIEASTVTERKA